VSVGATVAAPEWGALNQETFKPASTVAQAVYGAWSQGERWGRISDNRVPLGVTLATHENVQGDVEDGLLRAGWLMTTTKNLAGRAREVKFFVQSDSGVPIFRTRSRPWSATEAAEDRHSSLIGCRLG
jgi:hypothetical protein